MTDGTAVKDSSKTNERIKALKIRIASFFKFEERNTDLETETTAGVTLFLAMAYFIVINPQILAGVPGEEPGIIIEGYSHAQTLQMLAVVTIITSVLGMLVMGLYANQPFGIAPGLAFSTFFAVTIVGTLGIPWQTALAAVVVEGILYIILTAAGLRTYIIQLMPEPVKFSIGTGIGLFVTVIGLENMRIIVASSDGITLGSIASDPVASTATLGLIVALMMYARGMQGSIFLGIIVTAIIGWGVTLAGLVPAGTLTPESFPEPTYNIAPLAGAFMDGFGSINPFDFALVLFTLFFVDFFGTAGTLTGVGHQAGILDEKGDFPEMEKPLMADAISTTIGGMLGTSTLSTAVESAAGVEEGGRTGMTVLVVAALFLLTLVFVPIAGVIPTYAAGVALVLVGLIMLQNVVDVDWSDSTHAIPGGLTIILMPLTSIPYGIAAGLIAYPPVKFAVGEYDDVRLGQWLLAGLSVFYFIVRTGGVLQ